MKFLWIIDDVAVRCVEVDADAEIVFTPSWSAVLDLACDVSDDLVPLIVGCGGATAGEEGVAGVVQSLGKIMISLRSMNIIGHHQDMCLGSCEAAESLSWVSRSTYSVSVLNRVRLWAVWYADRLS